MIPLANPRTCAFSPTGKGRRNHRDEQTCSSRLEEEGGAEQPEHPGLQRLSQSRKWVGAGEGGKGHQVKYVAQLLTKILKF